MSGCGALATCYNHTILALSTTNSLVLRYMAITTGSASWREHLTSGDAPPLEMRVSGAILTAADDKLFFLPPKYELSHLQRTSPCYVLDFRRMLWTKEDLAFPDGCSGVDHMMTVLQHPGDFVEGVVLAHGNVLIRKGHHSRKSLGDPSMAVLRIDFLNKSVRVHAFNNLECPVRHHLALACRIFGDEGIVFVGGVCSNSGEPNEEVFLWRWSSSGQNAAAASSMDAEDSSQNAKRRQSNAAAAVGNATVLYDSPPPSSTLLSADVILSAGVTRVYSTMPVDYDPRYYAKMDMADQAKLLFVGPTSWRLNLADPYREWVEIRNAKDGPCQTGIPPLAGTPDGVVAVDCASGRHFVVSDKTHQMFVFHSCDAPARVVPVVPWTSPGTSGGVQLSRTLPLGQRSPFAPSTPMTPRSGTGGRPKNFDPRMHVEPPPPLPKVPQFRQSLLPPKKPKHSPTSGGGEGGAGATLPPLLTDALDRQHEKKILLCVLRKSKLPVAFCLLDSLRDDHNTVLNLSSCLTLSADEFVLIREVVGRFPHFSTLVLPTTALVNKVFLDTLRSLKSITEVEFPEEDVFVSNSAVDELQRILEDHQAVSDVSSKAKQVRQQDRALARSRKRKIRAETRLRNVVREQITGMIDELLERHQVDQLEGRGFIVISERGDMNVLLHNYAAGLDFLAMFSIFERKFNAEVSQLEEEQLSEMDAMGRAELKQRSDILKAERQNHERQRRQEQDDARERRRKQREECERVAEVERKGRGAVRHDEDRDRSHLAKIRKVEFEEVKEAVAVRLREEAKRRQQEYELQRALDELRMKHEGQQADVVRQESKCREQIALQGATGFVELKSAAQAQYREIYVSTVYRKRCADRTRCDRIPPSVTLTGDIEAASVAPLRNARWPRIITQCKSLQVSVQLGPVPAHLQATGNLDPPLPPSELRLPQWTKAKLTIRAVRVTLTMANLSEGCVIRFVHPRCREDAGMLFLEGVSDSVGFIHPESCALTVMWLRCEAPQDPFSLLPSFMMDTSNCLENQAAEMAVVLSLQYYFFDPSHIDQDVAASKATPDDDADRESYDNPMAAFEAELAATCVSSPLVSVKSSMKFVPPYIKLPEAYVQQTFTEGSAPLALLQYLELHVDQIMLDQAVLSLQFEAPESVGEDDRLWLPPASKIVVAKDGSIKGGQRVFGTVRSSGCLLYGQAALPAQSQRQPAEKQARRRNDGSGDTAAKQLQPSTSSALAPSQSTVQPAVPTAICPWSPGPVEIDIAPGVTSDMLLELIRAFHYRNDSNTPKEGHKPFSVGLRSPLVDMARRIDIDLQSFDNPTEINLNLASIAYRAPPAMAPALAQYVTQPLCYVGQYTTVVDPDTTEFSGGYLRVYLSGGTLAESVDLASEEETAPGNSPPAAVSVVGDDNKLLVKGREEGTVKRSSPHEFTILFSESSIASIETIIRSVVFQTSRAPKPGSGLAATVTIELVVADAAPVTASATVKVCEPLIVIPVVASFLTFREGGPPLQLPQPKLISEDANWCGGWIEVAFQANFDATEDLLLFRGTNLMQIEELGYTESRTSLTKTTTAAAAAAPGPAALAKKQSSVLALSTSDKKGAGGGKGVSSNQAVETVTGQREVIIDEKRYGVAHLSPSKIRINLTRLDDPLHKTQASQRLPKHISKKDILLILKHVAYKNISSNPRDGTKIATITVNDGNAQATSCPIGIEVQSTDSAAEFCIDTSRGEKSYQPGSSDTRFYPFDHIHLADPDTHAFNGATLNIELVAGGENNGTDCLNLQPAPHLTTVQVKGKEVYMHGMCVAKLLGGGAQPLMVQFSPIPKPPNSKTEANKKEKAAVVTAEAVAAAPTVYVSIDDVNAILQNVTFTCTASRPAIGQRIFSLKFTDGHLSSSAKVSVQVVPSPFTYIPSGGQPKFKVENKKPVAPFPQLLGNTVASRSGTVSVRIDQPFPEDSLVFMMPDKLTEDYSVRESHLVFEGKSCGVVVQRSQQEVCLDFDASSKMNGRHLQFFVRNVFFSTMSIDGSERTVAASLETPANTTTITRTLQVVSSDEPTEVVLDLADAPIAVKGSNQAVLIAPNAQVVDPDTNQFGEPDHIVFSILYPIPGMEELGVLDSDWCRVETSNGIVCDVSGKVLARLEYDSKTVSLTLRLVNVTLAELEKLVRRVAYRDVNENINGLDRRSVSVFVRTGQSFSRTLVDISVVPLPLRYNGPKSISVRKGGAGGPSSSCAPFADVTLVPGCFRKGCSGFVKISGVLEYEAVSALWMGIAVEANHYSNGGVVFSPQSSGDVHVMIGSKKIALMHAKRHVVTFTLTADLPKPEDALRVVLAAIRVHGEEGTFDEEATLNVTDGQVKCQAAVRVNSS